MQLLEQHRTLCDKQSLRSVINTPEYAGALCKLGLESPKIPKNPRESYEVEHADSRPYGLRTILQHIKNICAERLRRKLPELEVFTFVDIPDDEVQDVLDYVERFPAQFADNKTFFTHEPTEKHRNRIVVRSMK